MKNLSNQNQLIFAQMNENKVRFVYEVGGESWHKEVGGIDDSLNLVRDRFYNDRAELKGALGEDISGITMSSEPINAKGGYLFGALEQNFGEKMALKVLKLAENGGLSGDVFNVDKFPLGYTASIEVEMDGGYLVKRSKNGAVTQKVKIYETEISSVTNQPPTSDKDVGNDSNKDKANSLQYSYLNEDSSNDRVSQALLDKFGLRQSPLVLLEEIKEKYSNQTLTEKNIEAAITDYNMAEEAISQSNLGESDILNDLLNKINEFYEKNRGSSDPEAAETDDDYSFTYVVDGKRVSVKLSDIGNVQPTIIDGGLSAYQNKVLDHPEAVDKRLMGKRVTYIGFDESGSAVIYKDESGRPHEIESDDDEGNPSTKTKKNWGGDVLE